jgi:hypothetical protein
MSRLFIFELPSSWRVVDSIILKIVLSTDWPQSHIFFASRQLTYSALKAGCIRKREFLKLNNWSNFHRTPWKKIFLLQLTILAALKLTRAKAQNIIFFCCERVREWNTDNLISWTAPHCPGHALNKLSSFVYSSSYMLYAARRPKICSSHRQNLKL